MICNYISNIVTNKFNSKKEFYLEILYLMKKNLKINFNHTVLFLFSTIDLSVKYYKKTLFYAQKIVQS